MKERLQGLNIVWSGGECNGAFAMKVDGKEMAVCVIDGYLLTLDLETGQREECNLLIYPPRPQLPSFIKGAEIFYRSHSGRSGSIKLLIDPHIETRPLTFVRLYNDCLTRVIYSPDVLILVDRDTRRLVWLPAILKVPRIGEPLTCRIVSDLPKDDGTPQLIVHKAELINLPPVIRFVNDRSYVPYIPMAVEIKPGLWKDRHGLYFYAQTDEEAMEKVKAGL